MKSRSMSEALQRKLEIADELLQIDRLKKGMLAAVRQSEDFQKLIEQEKELTKLYAYWAEEVRQMGREGKTISDEERR